MAGAGREARAVRGDGGGGARAETWDEFGEILMEGFLPRCDSLHSQPGMSHSAALSFLFFEVSREGAADFLAGLLGVVLLLWLVVLARGRLLTSASSFRGAPPSMECELFPVSALLPPVA